MAVKNIIHTGLLRHPVVFKQPTSSLNDEGGREVTHSSAIITSAFVDTNGQFRSTEAFMAGLNESLDFYIRYASARDAINKDWLITYKGEDYTIHEIEKMEQKEKFIRFTGKVRKDG